MVPPQTSILLLFPIIALEVHSVNKKNKGGIKLPPFCLFHFDTKKFFQTAGDKHVILHMRQPGDANGANDTGPFQIQRESSAAKGILHGIQQPVFFQCLPLQLRHSKQVQAAFLADKDGIVLTVEPLFIVSISSLQHMAEYNQIVDGNPNGDGFFSLASLTIKTPNFQASL